MLKKVLATFLCILWMGFIFYNSSNNGEISEVRSHDLLNIIKNEYHKVSKGDKKVVDKNLKEGEISTKGQVNEVSNTTREERLNKILRKNAHAFEYLILAILVSAFSFSLKIKGREALIYIMFLCLFYAVTDEFHQAFVPGRSSLVSDVLIDFLGSLIGMLAFYIFYYKLHKSRLKKSKGLHYSIE